MLDYTFDISHKNEKIKVVCGVDEAGRGPFAGPVVAAACIMPDGFVIPEGSEQYTMHNGYIYHKWYPQLLGQITKFFRTWSIYLGAENMTNYTQENPIVGERLEARGERREAKGGGFVDPYSSNYDASMIWAPIHGWKMYIGFRWAIERAE